MLTPSKEELDDDALARLYGYPGECWLRANMVSSADGAGFLDGLSGGLSSAADRRLFSLLRALADVVLVGAGTARAEGYGPAKRRAALAGLRAGRSATPPIALVSRALELDFAAPLFTEAPPDARTIVITCAASPEPARAAAARVADVIMAGDLTVDLGAAMAALGERGHGRVLCEGGPHLLGQVAAAGLLDELCLSVSPLLAGPGAPRITAGSPFPAQPMTLAHVLADDGFLFCRYLAASALSHAPNVSAALKGSRASAAFPGTKRSDEARRPPSVSYEHVCGNVVAPGRSLRMPPPQPRSSLRHVRLLPLG